MEQGISAADGGGVPDDVTELRSVVGFQRNGKDMAVVVAETNRSLGHPLVYNADGNPNASNYFLRSPRYVAVDGDRIYVTCATANDQPGVGIFQLNSDDEPVGTTGFTLAGGAGPMDVDSQGNLWVAGQDQNIYEYSVSAAGRAQVIRTINAGQDLSSAPVSLQIEPPLTISSKPTLRGHVGRAVNFHVKADHGRTPYTFSVLRGTLPAGLKLNAKGVLSGTPRKAGRSKVTIKVVDSGRAKHKQTATAPLAFNIQPRQ